MLEKYLKGLHWFFRLIIILIPLVFLWIVLIYLAPKILPEARISSSQKWGIIWRNERWSGEVNVVGDIWALPGTTVFIDPGSRILVESRGDRFNLHWLPWGLKSGLNTGPDWFNVRNGELFWDEREKIQLRFAKLYAVGTPQQPVVFQSTSPRPGHFYDFNVISLSSGIISHGQFSNYRRLLVGGDVTIRDSYFNNFVECGVCIEYESPSIINNVFENTLRQHIFIIGGSPKISDNLFISPDCVEKCLFDGVRSEGIVIDPQGIGAPLIYYNDFEMTDRVAINVLTGSEEIDGGAISFNNFSGGSIVALPCDTKINLAHNQLSGIIKMHHSGNCVGSLTIGPNYWWTQDRSVILTEKILDKEPQFRIEIPELLEELPVSGRRTKNE